MKLMHPLVVLLALSAASFGNAATIVEIASETEELSTLVAAVQAAGLIDALNDIATPITVFAPTNDAFSALLTELDVTAEELLADFDTLQAVLAYHVVPGVFTSEDLEDGDELTTLLPGGTLTVAVEDGEVYIQPTGGAAAMVITADIEADNGIVHVIDMVLLPGPSETLAPSSE